VELISARTLRVAKGDTEVDKLSQSWGEILTGVTFTRAKKSACRQTFSK